MGMEVFDMDATGVAGCGSQSASERLLPVLAVDMEDVHGMHSSVGPRMDLSAEMAEMECISWAGHRR